ncbi:MAG: MAPEG family protein [Halieaceae bacterium]|jgi:hypothetical protein|nr:MAPEG family protein [Halieaceae bacterium]
MEWIALVTLLAAAQYFVLAILAGKARADAGIEAPACTGDERFERFFRVQQNTLEQLIIFFPALWVFGYYVSANAGAILGLFFLLGRYMYARGYVQHPDNRAAGFILGSLATLALIIGGLVGVVMALF